MTEVPERKAIDSIAVLPFANRSGNPDLDYLGDDWDRYKERYQPKHEPSKAEARRLIEFVKLVNRTDDEQFRKEASNIGKAIFAALFS